MNCGPEQKLSMEELKRLNPSRCSLPQMRTTLPPTPTQQDWRELLIAMDRLERRLSDQTAVLRELPIRTDACPTQPQIEALSQDVARIRTLLQQDGRKNARCALPGFVDSKNEEKTERNAGYLVVSHSGGGMLRQGTRKGIRRTPANRGMRAHRIVKSLDISEDVCHGMCP